MNFNQQLLHRYGRIELSRNTLLEMSTPDLTALFSHFYTMWVMPSAKQYDALDQIFVYVGRSPQFRDITEGEEAPFYEVIRTKKEGVITYGFMEVEQEKMFSFKQLHEQYQYIAMGMEPSQDMTSLLEHFKPKKNETNSTNKK